MAQSPRGNPNLPVGRTPRRIPFAPGLHQGVTQRPAVPDAPAVPPYVVTTYDAKPINAVTFNTLTGSNADDTGWDGAAGPYTASSTFYEVPSGRVAILRAFQILCVPATGQELAGSDPIFLTNGASNFRVVVSILVNGNFVEGWAGRVCWSLAFGDFFGSPYILANGGDIIELRVTSSFSGAETAASTWHQLLAALDGDLLLSYSAQLEFAPGSTDVLPVTALPNGGA